MVYEIYFLQIPLYILQRLLCYILRWQQNRFVDDKPCEAVPANDARQEPKNRRGHRGTDTQGGHF